jgi:hypothetical protein
LQAKLKGFLEHVNKLSVLWEQRSKTMEEMIKQGRDEYAPVQDLAQWTTAQDDSGSQYSYATTASEISNASVRSDMRCCYLSRNGNSMAHLLFCLVCSARSAASSASAGTFSVDGMAHSMLGVGSAGPRNEGPSRRQKRKEKRKGGGKSKRNIQKAPSWASEFHLCKHVLEAMDVSVLIGAP